MDTMIYRFRRRYGAGPLHLLALIASLLISGAAVAGWFASFMTSDIVRILIWFLGAAIAHDLVLLPTYSLIDRAALRGSGVHGPSTNAVARQGTPSAHSPGWAYVRVPALLSALLALVFFPEALRLGNSTFHAASGQTQDVYLARLLLTCGALFALSGVAYAASAGRARRAVGRSQNETGGGQHDAPRTHCEAQRAPVQRAPGDADEPVSPDTRAP